MGPALSASSRRTLTTRVSNWKSEKTPYETLGNSLKYDFYFVLFWNFTRLCIQDSFFSLVHYSPLVCFLERIETSVVMFLTSNIWISKHLGAYLDCFIIDF